MEKSGIENINNNRKFKMHNLMYLDRRFATCLTEFTRNAPERMQDNSFEEEFETHHILPSDKVTNIFTMNGIKSEC